ncbi:MAG: hypothetical protein KatS3mg092_0420 [Patescibacteria group bacterium]|nr:MAG: hypothetical protein KatS3mg092_0420 [Patescibacteria group bacterium]
MDLDKKLFFLYLFSLLLIKLFPVYIFIESRFFTTHSLSKIILILIFIILVFIKKEDCKLLLTKNSIFHFFIFFFITQTLSIIKSNNLLLFLKDFQNLLSFFVITFLSVYFLRKKNFLYKTFYSIVYLGFFIVLLDLLFFLFFNKIIFFLQNFIQKEVILNYQFNLMRNRYNLYLNSELFLPFFLLYFKTRKGKLTKTFSLIFIFILIFNTFASAFRHRLLLLIVVLTFLIRIKFRKKIVKNSLILVTLFLFFFFGFIFKNTTSVNIVDRTILRDPADLSSIEGRIENFKLSINLFFYSPIFGIGLGNFQEYSKDLSKFYNFDKTRQFFYSISSTDPHNIISKVLAETGIIGLVGYVALIFKFFQNDFFSFSDKRVYNKELLSAFIVGFWGLFILSLITPSITIFRGGWMWFFRGVIETFYYKKKSNKLTQ